MKTVKELADEYARECIHPQAPRMQVLETQIAFVAGMKALLDEIIRNAPSQDDQRTDRDFAATIKSIYDQTNDFARNYLHERRKYAAAKIVDTDPVK